ncbi:protein of unknown function [Arenibacter nanhaiticus]|uniref:3-keto-alpha-glucoside-1,2-lyase/3-keto-2-hydroxy-glucal hydratase domain-containing protein n=1 Tax=Arenibacter nanhaiticus TaxID=558155 RepID=A0A1M6AH13_9FLAO|nr:DUF1080 domain-containing protein [Arenibacter nanhaiticus]SHI35608.1 protein of unknown function [Arenibacter nanhaiticus]
MKNLWITAFVAILTIGCKEKTTNAPKEQPMENANTEMSTKPDQGEWKVLFDGTNFDAWKGYGQEGVEDAWKIEEGAMVFYPPKERKEGANYNLVSKEEFRNFVLSIDWKISEGGNSGVFWGVREIPSLSEAYQSGPEIQVLDNEKHPDAKNGTTHQAGALYDMIAPSKDVTNPVGEWNTFVITVNHNANQGSVVLNGEVIVEFPVNGEPWNEMVEKSKFKGWEHFGKYATGKIGLQDHGDIVSFKNIKIKSL